MKRILLKGLAIIGGLTVVVVLLLILGMLFYAKARKGIPAKTILDVDFTKTLVEYVPSDLVADFVLAKKLVLLDIVEGLQKAAEDERVVGLVARLGTVNMGLAQIQEIRTAVQSFRQRGKTAVAYAETFGEFGPGNGAYYLATAFDRVYLQPSGDVGLTGLMYETVFLRGSLDKLGISPRLDQRYEYKNAMNQLTEKRYTQPHREAIQRVMESQFGQIVQGIAQARGVSEAEVRGLIDKGPFLGPQAVDAGLVDGLAYRDEVYEKAKKEAGGDAQFLHLTEYLDRAGRFYGAGETIALIYGVGGVQRGKSDFDPASGSFIMGSDTVTDAFRRARKDPQVKAILFRVDSPGGSYVASDAIWRETVRARQAGKPVIVSMGNVAGSGGYFVAMAADKIVAQPGTITGSIGVLGGKMLTSGLWKKLGLSWDEVHTSANATMWTGTRDYTPAQWARFQAWLDRIYEDFTSKVAEGRSLPKDRVLQLARGRIWSGEDALELGLVDATGGFTTALTLAREAAAIPADKPIWLKRFPPKKSRLEMLLDENHENSGSEQVSQVLSHTLKTIQPLIRSAWKMGLLGPPGVLVMPVWNPVW